MVCNTQYTKEYCVLKYVYFYLPASRSHCTHWWFIYYIIDTGQLRSKFKSRSLTLYISNHQVEIEFPLPTYDLHHSRDLLLIADAKKLS